jgi:CheY-like chemotaxis protein
LSHRPPDLLLLDLMLPDIDGAQIIERMRANPAWQHIPILVVSAQDESDYRASLPGAMAVAKASGLTPGEVVQWVQHVADTAARLPALPGKGGRRGSMAN